MEKVLQELFWVPILFKWHQNISGCSILEDINNSCPSILKPEMLKRANLVNIYKLFS